MSKPQLDLTIVRSQNVVLSIYTNKPTCTRLMTLTITAFKINPNCLRSIFDDDHILNLMSKKNI